MIRTLFASFLLVWLTGCSSLGISLYPTGHFLTPESEAVLEQAPSPVPLPRELELSVVEAHYLQPGDVLLIEPVEFSDSVRLPADQPVLADGTIDLGGFGRLMVAGMTLEEAEAGVEQRLVAMEARAAQVNIRLLDAVDRYYVLGEVQSPGSYPLIGHETVLDGILMAGGLTDRAAQCKILLARPTPPPSCRTVLPICYRQLTQLGDTSTNYQLRPGDRIFVASRTCCEELMFWRANQTCDRCCGCQRACPHPEATELGSPVSPMLPLPPGLPNWSQDEQREQAGPLKIPATVPPPVGSEVTDQGPDPLPVPRQSVPRSPSQRLPPPRAGPADSSLDGELDFDSPLID